MILVIGILESIYVTRRPISCGLSLGPLMA